MWLSFDSPRYLWFIWEVNPGSTVREWGSETETVTETPVCVPDGLSLYTTGVSSCVADCRGLVKNCPLEGEEAGGCIHPLLCPVWFIGVLLGGAMDC